MRELRREFLTLSCAQFPPCGNHAAGGRLVVASSGSPNALAARARREQGSRRHRRYRCERLIGNWRLDLTPNQGLSLPVRLRSSPHNGIGLVGEGLPLLLPRRGEAIGQATEIVIIIAQASRTGFPCSPRAAVLGLELRGLRSGDQSEIVFGVLETVLRGDRIVACVSVACQLKVPFSHMQRTATNSDVRAVRVIRTTQGVGFATAICLAATISVILTK